jgi:two-component system phosphate regulon sensor histidine kinase PhoR
VKNHLLWKWLGRFSLLLLAFLLVQSVLFYLLRIPFIVASLLGALMLLLPAYLITKSLTQPVHRLTEIAERYLTGISDRPIRSLSDDEVGRLSQVINEIGTQLKNRIENIAKEKEYLQAVLTGMVEGVLVVDGRARIVMANDALRQFLSLPSNVTDRTPLEVIRNSELEGAIRKVIREGGRQVLELNLPPSGGQTLEVNVVGISSASSGAERAAERVDGAIAVFHNITRQKQLEKIRQDFVANVSHELRTPLTTIKGYAETLIDGALKEDVAPQFVQVIKKHADRLEKLVEDLLMLSKIETRASALKPERLSLTELINDALDVIKEPAEKKNISITREQCLTSVFVYGDRNALEQVLINLLDNAVKYGRQGGKILLSAVEKDHREIQISVKDDGIGIPREDLPRIFERFYRVDKGRSQELGGTGLGLSIVKHIVQAHGGQVWAESEPGKGSTFYFTLPTVEDRLSSEQMR